MNISIQAVGYLERNVTGGIRENKSIMNKLSLFCK